MNVNGKHYRTIWFNETDPRVIHAIDQRFLPHKFVIEDLRTVDAVAVAIRDMHVRGAGLIGAAAGFGMYLAALHAPQDDGFDEYISIAGDKLKATRPTAVNLVWAVDKQLEAMKEAETLEQKIHVAFDTANEIASSDVTSCKQIGEYGLALIEAISKQKQGKTVHILTHCNAGWLAFVDYGSATAPVYAAFNKGIDIHVWVDETRPRNQGASLTAWELGQHKVPHTIIPDNVGGHLMQHGMVDIVIVGTDRTTYTGDVANKIGTYLKALAAFDNDVPFYVALPSSSFDWNIKDGIKEIPIEERGAEEVKYMEGLCDGEIKKILLTPAESKATNFGFDVTPARLVTGLITERGICKANKESILSLFPEKKNDIQEGYIKFHCHWIKAAPVPGDQLKEIIAYRDLLYSKGLIGVYPNGVGFGNISIRSGKAFIITGSATGQYPASNEEHYAVVVDYNLKQNSLTCTGPLKASSESLSHAVIYESSPDTNAVIHIHHMPTWQSLMDKVPTTAPYVTYGTPEMAEEIKRLFRETNVAQEKILVMGGHEEGIITFGKTLEEASRILLDHIINT